MSRRLVKALPGTSFVRNTSVLEGKTTILTAIVMMMTTTWTVVTSDVAKDGQERFGAPQNKARVKTY